MKPRLTLAVLWLLDPESGQPLTGGMERWCRDVARLASSRGYTVTVFQKARRDFAKEIEPGITVQGVRATLGFAGNYTVNQAIRRAVAPGEPVLYVSQELALPNPVSPAVAVNHGIWWDGDYSFAKKAAIKVLHRRWLRTLRGIICVDTNYINWCHAELPGRSCWAHKLRYIPNYADVTFVSRSDAGDLPPGPPYRLLFPRRLSGQNIKQQGRGAGLFLEAAAVLEKLGIEVALDFVGRGNLAPLIEQYARDIGLRATVSVQEVPLDDMPDIYANAHVVVVPSLEHEGTSLSAVEGLLSGRPVVVSHIGGLANIVVHGLNGFVCDLTPQALAARIHEALAVLPSEQTLIRDRCVAALGKERWEKDVWRGLTDLLDLR